MKIIKHGKIPEKSTVKRFECRHCGCVFEAENKECHYGSQYNEHYCYCECPECGHSVSQEA